MKIIINTFNERTGEIEAAKISAMTDDGYFEILPGHIDMIALIAPGILKISQNNSGEIIYASDHGIIIKTGDTVKIALRNAVRASSVSALSAEIKRHFLLISEQEKAGRIAVSELAHKTGAGA